MKRALETILQQSEAEYREIDRALQRSQERLKVLEWDDLCCFLDWLERKDPSLTVLFLRLTLLEEGQYQESEVDFAKKILGYVEQDGWAVASKNLTLVACLVSFAEGDILEPDSIIERMAKVIRSGEVPTKYFGHFLKEAWGAEREILLQAMFDRWMEVTQDAFEVQEFIDDYVEYPQDADRLLSSLWLNHSHQQDGIGLHVIHDSLLRKTILSDEKPAANSLLSVVQSEHCRSGDIKLDDVNNIMKAGLKVYPLHVKMSVWSEFRMKGGFGRGREDLKIMKKGDQALFWKGLFQCEDLTDELTQEWVSTVFNERDFKEDEWSFLINQLIDRDFGESLLELCTYKMPEEIKLKLVQDGVERVRQANHQISLLAIVYVKLVLLQYSLEYDEADLSAKIVDVLFGIDYKAIPRRWLFKLLEQLERLSVFSKGEEEQAQLDSAILKYLLDQGIPADRLVIAMHESVRFSKQRRRMILDCVSEEGAKALWLSSLAIPILLEEERPRDNEVICEILFRSAKFKAAGIALLKAGKITDVQISILMARTAYQYMDIKTELKSWGIQVTPKVCHTVEAQTVESEPVELDSQDQRFTWDLGWLKLEMMGLSAINQWLSHHPEIGRRCAEMFLAAGCVVAVGVRVASMLSPEEPSIVGPSGPSVSPSVDVHLEL